MSSEGWGRIAYFTTIRQMLERERPVRRYFEGETTELPEFYVKRIKRELGPLWEYLPAGALEHDQNAYLKTEDARQPAFH